jgi:hypothetical protein
MHQPDSLPLPPGAYWVTILPDKHRIHAAGTRFLVVAEPHAGVLLCWKGGRQHDNPKSLGEYLQVGQVERIKGCEGLE